jgi:hypothetical protein
MLFDLVQADENFSLTSSNIKQNLKIKAMDKITATQRCIVESHSKAKENIFVLS